MEKTTGYLVDIFGDFAKVNVVVGKHNQIEFSELFSIHDCETKYAAILMLCKNVAEGESEDSVLVFEVEKSGVKGKRLMKRLTRQGFPWQNHEERFVGVDDGNGIVYRFAISLSEIRAMYS